MPIFIDPNTRQRILYEQHSGDFQYDLSGDEAIVQETVPVIGNYSDWTTKNLTENSETTMGSDVLFGDTFTSTTFNLGPVLTPTEDISVNTLYVYGDGPTKDIMRMGIYSVNGTAGSLLANSSSQTVTNDATIEVISFPLSGGNFTLRSGLTYAIISAGSGDFQIDRKLSVGTNSSAFYTAGGDGILDDVVTFTLSTTLYSGWVVGHKFTNNQEVNSRSQQMFAGITDQLEGTDPGLQGERLSDLNVVGQTKGTTRRRTIKRRVNLINGEPVIANGGKSDNTSR